MTLVRRFADGVAWPGPDGRWRDFSVALGMPLCAILAIARLGHIPHGSAIGEDIVAHGTLEYAVPDLILLWYRLQHCATAEALHRCTSHGYLLPEQMAKSAAALRTSVLMPLAFTSTHLAD